MIITYSRIINDKLSLQIMQADHLDADYLMTII